MADKDTPPGGGAPGDKGPGGPTDIRTISITDEMKRSYLDYAMSVIVSRALPDVRDGLKPVHRRVLYAMRRLNLTADAAFRKSAKVVGDVMGDFHPHGDQSIYDALVRLAQDFNARYPLIDGQGNFGNIDGDNPAAMRYTESRMTKAAEALLEVAQAEQLLLDFLGALGIARPHAAGEAVDGVVGDGPPAFSDTVEFPAFCPAGVGDAPEGDEQVAGTCHFESSLQAIDTFTV